MMKTYFIDIDKLIDKLKKTKKQNKKYSLANWATSPSNKEAILDTLTNRVSPSPLLSAQTNSLTNEVVPSHQNCRAFPTSLGSGNLRITSK
jgi:hypothetical protein